MYYKVDIFFRNVHHLSDARFAAGVWAKWLSFNFDKNSPHYISPMVVADIIPWLSGPEIVAEFSKTDSKEYILEICKLLDISTILLDAENNIDFSGHVFTKDTFTKNTSSEKFLFLPISPSEEFPEKSEIKNISIEGVFEEKPGSADYEELSIFLEKLEV